MKKNLNKKSYFLKENLFKAKNLIFKDKIQFG